ncbi:hypothetical protein E5161_20365 [Cohnella pontilimi]|uniref:Uncharacterized protein n=1 Tax=Cohnella pontilimi TaxID=2564100 RepID=A0A4U0F1W3_9BACL|nr:hypothetical protein [Cohnella pontilimi]TJY38260.1 hypothetical protein E5161_20365 [Cohnella pontilimi]
MHIFEVLLMSAALGLRHGVDWDHVAALADITGSRNGTKKNRFVLSLWYALGHESVVCLLGSAIILTAWSIPVWADHLMGKAVGVTLVVMGAAMLLSRKREEQSGHLSRGIVWFAKIRKLILRSQSENMPETFVFSKKSVFLVGIIHGIGAETPTQLLLFTTLAGVAADSAGIVAVAAFSLGLFVTHAALAAAGIWLHGGIRGFRVRFPFTMYAASLLSLILGVKYLIEAF